MKNATIGQQVVRSKGDYVVGRIGNVVAIDLAKNRAQVMWEGNPTTWVSFASLEPTSIPYEIVNYKYSTLNAPGNVPGEKIMENQIKKLRDRMEELETTMVNTFSEQRDRNREMFVLAAELEKLTDPKSYEKNKSHWELHEIRL